MGARLRDAFLFVMCVSAESYRVESLQHPVSHEDDSVNKNEAIPAVTAYRMKAPVKPENDTVDQTVDKHHRIPASAATGCDGAEKIKHDGLVFFVCARSATIADFSEIPLVCTQDVPLSSAGKPDGEFAKLLELFEETTERKGLNFWHRSKDSPARIFTDWMITADKGFANRSVHNVTSVEEDAFLNFLTMFPRRAVIRPDMTRETKPYRSSEQSRFLLCYGPSVDPSDAQGMNKDMCTGFFRHHQKEIGLWEQLSKLNETFSNPDTLEKAQDEAQELMEQVCKEVPSDAGKFGHTTEHAAVFYSAKITVLVTAKVIGSALLTLVGHILLIPLPFVVYTLIDEGRISYEASKKVERMQALLDGARAEFLSISTPDFSDEIKAMPERSQAVSAPHFSDEITAIPDSSQALSG